MATFNPVNDNQAGRLYREVTGNFVVTVRLEVMGTNRALPYAEFSLAGLFVRAPREFSAATWTPGGENWLGELFTLLHKPQGARAWRVVDQMIRPDLSSAASRSPISTRPPRSAATSSNAAAATS